jgi:prepilin-type N-terminal cleavage/methylation domain-containing protein
MKFRATRGFTLIELMVVVGIISVMLGMGIAQYGRFRDRQGVLRAADYVVTHLRDAQKRASAGVNTCPSGERLIAYRITPVIPAASTYTQFRISQVCTSTTTVVVTANVPNGASYSSFDTFRFPVLAGRVQTAAGVERIDDLLITVSLNSCTTTVTVSPAGQISASGTVGGC